jgi:hypothetical protein
MPRASSPQAAVCASRMASASEAAEAVALFRAFLKPTVTEHSTRWEERVDQSRNPAKASSTSTVRSLPRLVTRFSGWAARARNPAMGPPVLVDVRGKRTTPSRDATNGL